MSEMLFELIKLSGGKVQKLTSIPTAIQWEELMSICKDQAILAYCFYGASIYKEHIPFDVYRKWMSYAAKIQILSEGLDDECIQLHKILSGLGCRAFIMKGQGNQLLYPQGLFRQPGDIDIFVEGGRKRVIEIARSLGKVSDINELEMHLNIFKKTDVEVHFRPFILRDFRRNRILQKFFDRHLEGCYSNLKEIQGEKVSFASIEFNLVHQLVHICHHLYTEGIGLKHLMDYQYVLESAKKENIDCSDAVSTINKLNLNRFASALMWVLKEALGSDPDTLLWTPNQKDGEFLLREVLQSGNFGAVEKKGRITAKGRVQRFLYVHLKTIKYYRFDHRAWFCSPVWRICHFISKKVLY